MSEKFTQEENLQLCNLTSWGKSMEEAKEIVISKRKKKQTGQQPKVAAPTTQDKKEAIAKELDLLGAEVPSLRASLAVFEQALSAAKEEKEETPLI